MRGKKGGLWQDYMGWMILGVVVLVIVLVGYMIIFDKGQSTIEYVKGLFLTRG